jgi:serine/threonine-protein kinase
LVDASGAGAPDSSSARRAAVRGGTDVLPVSIDGHQIISLLGAGGMGAVYLAYDPLMDRQIALKLLSHHSDDAMHAKNAARFLSEAVLTGKLDHAGIAPIYKVGFDESWGYYYTMRYVKGRTIAQIVRQLAEGHSGTTEEFTLSRLLALFQRACEAIGFAHRHGVVHRDVKPANIMLAEFGEVLVLDWGLAKDVSSSAPTYEDGVGAVAARLAECRRRHQSTTQVFLAKERQALSKTTYLKRLQAIRPSGAAAKQKITGFAQILGTPGYLSPEQGEGKEVTPASDVYGLGVTLYEMLVHCLPVAGETTDALILNTIVGKLALLRDRPEAARLPKVLCEIVDRALALKPEDRYTDAIELANELALYLEGRSPWRKLAGDPGEQGALGDSWEAAGGAAAPSQDGLVIETGSRLRCKRAALGDFRGQFEFWARGDGDAWTLNVSLREVDTAKEAAPRYHMRFGVARRPFVELLRNGKCVQRRLDLRLQSGRWYTARFELEQEMLRLWLNGRKYIEYHEVFPQTGGMIEVEAECGTLGIKRFASQSRGAPLHLSFMVLPDRLYRDGQYAEARGFYRRLAESHPDREEGLRARFKAGLCSTLINDTQDAFQEFTLLENTMYDHCCAIGLAEIGLVDGNIDWAWEALKNGYRRHQQQDVRGDLWFALLHMIEHLPAERAAEKVARYRELLVDLVPPMEEAGRIVCGLLELLQDSQGCAEARREAVRLLQAFPGNAFVRQEALFALSRVGVDAAGLEAVATPLDETIKAFGADAAVARLHILRAEACLALADNPGAERHLHEAISYTGLDNPEGLWARNWQMLALYLGGQHQRLMTSVHETQLRHRRSSSGQQSYLWIMEALAYWSRKQASNAASAMGRAASDVSMWGRAALHWVQVRPAEELVAAVLKANSSQVAEACFLVGEAHRLGGNTQVADKHFAFCLDPRYERAMFSRAAAARMSGPCGAPA